MKTETSAAPSAEVSSSVGPGGDVSHVQNMIDGSNETASSLSCGITNTEKPNDTVMDDIMADVDVVEEVILSQNENEQTLQQFSSDSNSGSNNLRVGSLSNKEIKSDSS